MYRNNKYRTGTASLSRSVSSRSTNIANTDTFTAGSSTNFPITSTPIEANLVEIIHPSAVARPLAVDDDSAEIPASQFVPLSRYVSQRSMRLQSQAIATQLTPSSYFENILQKCGIRLTARHSEHSFTIACDHMKFVNNLRKELKSHAKYPENVQSFLSGLANAMRIQTQLTKLLSGCIISLPNTDVTKQSQESIMNDFLMVDFLQADIIEILLNKVKLLAVQDTGVANMEIELILAQLKFVDHLTNGDVVCEKLFDILELAANDARQSIIRSLEDIVDLTRHNDVARKLMELMPTDAELLTASTIDTFGNMCLSSDIYAAICEKIVRFIKSDAPVELLPCFTKFVLRFNHQNTDKLADIIRDLRSCLKWPQFDVPMSRAIVQKNQKEVFGCISRSLIRSKQLYDVWLKRIQAECGTAKPIDFIILLMMMTINDERSNYIENITNEADPKNYLACIFRWKLIKDLIYSPMPIPEMKSLKNKNVKRVAVNVGHKVMNKCIILFEFVNFVTNALRFATIRRKLRATTINVRLLEETVQLFPTILLDYSKILFELLEAFARDKNADISSFAGVAYRIVFGIENCDRKVLLSKLIGFVYDRHAQATSLADGCCSAGSAMTATTDITTNALMILTEINLKYPIEMQNNGLQILRILDGCNEFTLLQYRMVMNILCSLAFTQPPCEMLKDHIDKLIKKQVSSSIRAVKNRGIIGVVRLVDHMIWEPNSAPSEAEDLNSSYNTIEDLPSEVSKAAANYIDLMLTSAQNCPHHLALGLDELASVFLVRNRNSRTDAQHINKPFLIWLSDLISNYFENNFVIEELPGSNSSLPLEFMRTLNQPEDSDSEIPLIGINIAGCVLNPSANSLSSIQVLSSLFNLMRILFWRLHDGVLTLINAVLGAAVVLPKIMLSADNIDVDLFDELDDERARKVLDMHFYTVNYWRECISAFVGQLQPMMRSKVLTRLTEVIELEGRIREIMQMAPDDYVPPNCLFTSEKTASKFKRPAVLAAKKAAATSKRRKIADKSAIIQVNDESNDDVEFSGQTIARTPAMRKKSFGNIFVLNAGPNEYFRHLDPDVMLLFDEELILQYPLPEEKIGHALGLLEFKFLMEDLTFKIESIFGVRKYSTVGHHFGQNIPFPALFLSDVVQMLPKIFTFSNQLANQLKIIIDKATANNTDADVTSADDILYTDESNYIKCCFGLCLRLLAAQFTWPGYDDDANKELLSDSLNAIIGDIPLNPGETEISDIALVALKSITANANVALDLQTAVYMIDLSKTLIKYVKVENAYDEFVSKICKQFLSKDWYASDGSEARGLECNACLDKLLQGFFYNAKFSFIRKQLAWIVEEIRDATGKNGFLKTFPCFKKANFPLLYRAIFATVIEALHRKLDKSSQNLGQLKVWESSCAIINRLLDLAKLIDLSRVFTIFLKNTHAYLKMFLQHGMPTIEIVMRRNAERVSAFLKNLQNSTRFLHTLCCHSKNIKNSAIIVQIPLLRETITQLVYKVKAALAANKCSSAFWMGNLKNKNIYGEEILSQTTSITGSNLAADDDNGDDDDESELLLDNDNGDSERGAKRQSNRNSTAKARKRKLNRNKSDCGDDSSVDDDDLSRSRCF